jgi:hypothetical protein
VYVFEDSALDTNAGDDASPIKNLPVQAARQVATKKRAPPPPPPPPPKPKRSKRHPGEKKATNRTVASTLAASVPKTVITPSKAELLETGTPRAQEALEVWYTRLGELHDYKKKFGHTCVPQKYPENPSLGTWVNKQRMEYKQHNENLKSSMTQQKLQALEELEFDWGKRKGDTAWEQKFNELVAYKEANNDCKYLSRLEMQFHSQNHANLYSHFNHTVFPFIYSLPYRSRTNKVQTESSSRTLGEHSTFPVQASPGRTEIYNDTRTCAEA